MSRSRKTLSGALILGVLGALALWLAASPWSEASDPARTQTDCPGVDRAFEEAGVEPIEFDNGCPEQLAGDVSEAIERADDPRLEAVIEALEEGRIQEGQDPYTYPPDLREALGLEGKPPPGYDPGELGYGLGPLK